MGMLSSSFRPKLRTKLLPAHQIKLMKVLRFSATELDEHLREESYANPVLEVQVCAVCPRCGRGMAHKGCPQCHRQRTTSSYDTPSYGVSSDENLPDPTERIQSPYSFYLSLAAQCGELPFSDAERDIAAYLLSELDERGLLTGTIAEHATYLEVTEAEVGAVRRRLLHLDPIGIAAMSVRECLAIKVQALSPAPSWAATALRLLQGEWEQLMGDLDFARVARAMRLNQREVLDVMRHLTTLSPYPLHGLRDDERDTLPAVPDVRFEVVGKDESATVLIDVVERERTAIQVNHRYLQGQPTPDPKTQEQLGRYRRDAQFLRSAVEQRWKTMERVCHAIFDAQRTFFTSGRYCPTALVPLTREQIAATLQMHPSTIGRAIEEKYAALPCGRVVPLRYFFDQNVPIRALLRRHITAESSAMSDGDLCDFLARRGWNMSRRAAAYHREAANILPKKLRTRERLLHHASAS